ncbi:MAG: hypothetical protein V8R90_08885, partial [Eubacterium sp.]
HVSGGSGVAVRGTGPAAYTLGGGVERSGSGGTHPSEFPKNSKAQNHPNRKMAKNPITVNHPIYNVSINTASE